MTNRQNPRYLPIVPGQFQPGEKPALKYHEGMGEQVKLLAQDGKWPEEWCAELGIHKSTLYAWCLKHPEFEEAVRVAWVLLAAYWSKWVRENVGGTPPEGQTGADPKAKVNAVLKMLERRLPSIWGQDAKMTPDHYEDWAAAQRSPAVAELSPQERAGLSDEQLAAKIAAFEARRAAEGAK